MKSPHHTLPTTCVPRSETVAGLNLHPTRTEDSCIEDNEETHGCDGRIPRARELPSRGCSGWNDAQDHQAHHRSAGSGPSEPKARGHNYEDVADIVPARL